MVQRLVIVLRCDMLTKKIGDATVLAFAKVAAQMGETILFPFGDCERYDIAFDRDGRLFRVQCKTGRLRDGVIVFRTVSQHWSRKSWKQYDEKQIDAVGVFCHELDRAYLVPVSYVSGRSECSLRIGIPKRREWKNVKLASEFELQPDVKLIVPDSEVRTTAELEGLRRVRLRKRLDGSTEQHGIGIAALTGSNPVRASKE